MPARRAGPLGFTLIEVLIALAIIASVGAVAIPMLAHRLNAMLVEADLSQVESNVRALPTRLATLGIELVLDKPGLADRLPDGRRPIELPDAWTIAAAERAPAYGRGGICSSGTLLLASSNHARHWRIEITAPSCAVKVLEVAP